MKSIVAPCLAVILASSLLFSCGKGAKTYTIGYIQITESPVLEMAHDGLVQALKEDGFVDGRNIRIDKKSAQGDLAMIPQILQSFIMSNVDMVITCGTPCMAGAAQSVRSIPVVYTVAFSLEQLGSRTPENMAGVYDPLDMDVFVALIREASPAIRSIGLPYNPSEANAQYAATALQKACDRAGIALVPLTVSGTNEVVQACQSLVQRGVNAYAIAADNTLALAQDAVVKSAVEHKIPLFVSDASLVDRGACAGTGVDYTEWGRSTGRIAARIIRGASPASIGTVPITNQQVYLNRTAAEAQGIRLPETLVRRATKVIP